MRFAREARAEWRRLRAIYPELLRYQYKENARLKRRLGLCRTRIAPGGKEVAKGSVELAAVHLDAGPLQEVIDTVRHEAAHAIAAVRFGSSFGARHGPRWRAIARELDCRPATCGTVAASQAIQERHPAPYVVYCRGCGQTWERYRVSECFKDGSRMHTCGGVIHYRRNERA